jgi:hypothetical protein
MNRIQLEHIIRAASQISGDAEIVVVGSQAIHAQDIRNLPPIAFQSMEADVYPRNHPERGRRDGALPRPARLVLSKYAAGREQDLAFNQALVRHGCVRQVASKSKCDSDFFRVSLPSGARAFHEAFATLTVTQFIGQN